MNNLLTATRSDTLLSCPRKHFWAFEIGLRPTASASALRFGKAWHLAMEARWHGLGFEDALSKAIPEGVDLDELQVATLSGLLAGYFKFYENQEFIKSVHAEVEFRQALIGSRTFDTAGKIDGLAVLNDDRLALVEHKTTSASLDNDSDYWLRLRFNSQVFQYVLAARSLGWDVSTVVYDVVRKPAIEPKTVPLLDNQDRKVVLDLNGQRVFKKDGEPRESGDKEKGFTLQTRIETPEEFNERLTADTLARPQFYFARREVPILEGDLEQFKVQRLALSKVILHYRATERKLTDRASAWPRHVSEFGCRGCAYNSFCLQNISVDLDRPPGGFQVGSATPELTEVPA